MEAKGSDIYNEELGKTCFLHSAESQLGPGAVRYSIVDLDSFTVKNGNIIDERINYVLSATHQCAWEGNRLYFSNCKDSIGNDYQAANFGCFNTDTCELEFTQYLPNRDAAGIMQIEAVEGKVFVRTTLNELYVYELSELSAEEEENKIGIPHKTKNTEGHSDVYTNFSEHGLPELDFELSGDLSMDIILCFGKLSGALKKQSTSLKVGGFSYMKLFDEGVLKIPVLFSSEGKNYSLFVIYDDRGALEYNTVTEQINDSEYPIPLYISKVDCSKVYDKANPLVPLFLTDLMYMKGNPPTIEYAMWWTEQVGSTYSNSKTKQSLDDLYKRIQGYEDVVIDIILSNLMSKEPLDYSINKLAKKEEFYIIEGPEYIKIVLGVSQEKGIRFLFPLRQVSEIYRERFMKWVVKNICDELNILKSKVELIKDSKSQGYEWYKNSTSMLINNERSEDIKNSLILGSTFFT